MVSFYSHPNKYERLLILVWVFRTSKCNVTKGHQVAGMNHLKIPQLSSCNSVLPFKL